MERMHKVLFEKWQLSQPKLVISVTGGAKISLNTQLKESVSKSLVKVAMNTRAWVTSGGSYNGCMRLIGDAFKNNTHSIDSDKNVTVLGIANWCTITNNEQLLNKNVSYCHQCVISLLTR